MTPVQFLPAAREEFLAAADFDERQAPGLGGDFIAEIDKNLLLLATNPELGATWRHQTRRWPIRRFPFSLVYQVQSDQLVVMAVSHQRRRQGYWRQRLSTT